MSTYSGEQKIHFSSHSYAASHGVSWMLVMELSKAKASLDQAEESSVNQEWVKIGYWERNVQKLCFCRSRHSWIFWFCTELPIWTLKFSLSTENRTENVIFLKVSKSIRKNIGGIRKDCPKKDGPKQCNFVTWRLSTCVRLSWSTSTKCSPKWKDWISPK